jgi:hypothetical protein
MDSNVAELGDVVDKIYKPENKWEMRKKNRYVPGSFRLCHMV